MKKLSSVCLAAALTLTACASIVSKSDWPVSVQSTPTGIPFTVTNRAGTVISSGKTPQTITLPSGAGYFKPEHYTIQFNQAGKLTTRDVSADLNGWYVGNIVFGFLIGFLIVDPLTGAMYRLPETVTQNMEPLNVSMNEKELRIVSIDQLTPTQREQLILIQ